MTIVSDKTEIKELLKPIKPKPEPERNSERVPPYPLSISELREILGLTIKADDANKIVTFLVMLSAYSEDSQMNQSFQAPSSSGKSYIPLEIAELFPPEDIIQLSYASPTAFFHDKAAYDESKKIYSIDLERKILIFLDMPHYSLLQHLRPLLSHDQKVIKMKITDRSQKSGLKTKNIHILGFPSVVFCSANQKMDEQELTRFILLSPETTSEKIRQSIYERVKKESDKKSYLSLLESNPSRQMLKKRIAAIKNANIQSIDIEKPELIQKMFFQNHKILKPRHSRDIGKIISIIKALALLNLWNRKRTGVTLYASEDDIGNAFSVWATIGDAQELSISPYIYSVYKEVILPAWLDKKKEGLSRQDIQKAYYKMYGRPVASWILRQEILPAIENSGLIIQEPDSQDKRKMLVYPQDALTISPGAGQDALTISPEQNNSERVPPCFSEKTEKEQVNQGDMQKVENVQVSTLSTEIKNSVGENTVLQCEKRIRECNLYDMKLDPTSRALKAFCLKQKEFCPQGH
jgi:hypothetical protein